MPEVRGSATCSSPQKMLDELVGRLSFDPLEFTRLSAKEQREALLDLVELDVDLDELAAERARIFDARTEVGRQGKAIGDVVVDESLPTEEESASSIISEIQEITRLNGEWNRRKEDEIAAAKECERINDEIARLQHALEDAKAHFSNAQESRSSLPEPRDTSDLEAKLATVEETNAKIRANNEARKQVTRKEALRQDYEALTAKIAELDTMKADALKAAKFPVAGLGFDESGVTYRGVPFAQASSAEQIRVSIAMAMAMNPKLHVLRIKDGSLLDDESLAAIRDQVSANDYQLWIERVGNADEGAVIIEDGEVA